MTGTLHTNNEKVVNFGDPSGATNASNNKDVDTIANNILSGSETFQGNINTSNNRNKTLHTPSSNTDAVNKVFSETTYRKKKVKITNCRNWELVSDGMVMVRPFMTSVEHNMMMKL